LAKKPPAFYERLRFVFPSRSCVVSGRLKSHIFHFYARCFDETSQVDVTLCNKIMLRQIVRGFFAMKLFVFRRLKKACLQVLVPVFVGSAALSGPVFAADSAQKESEATPLPTVTVTKDACEAVVAFQPEPGVEYQPGVDVNGQAVTPAEGPGAEVNPMTLPDVIEFPVTIDFFEFVGISTPTGISGKGNLGQITYRNGQVYFNGKPIGNAAHNADLIAACRAAGYR
jgi:hypothetical protein